MSASPQRTSQGHDIAWDDLALSLFRLNPLHAIELPKKITQCLSSFFGASRTSLVFFNAEEGAPGDLIASDAPEVSRCSADEANLATTISSAQQFLILNAGGAAASGKRKQLQPDSVAGLPLLHDNTCFAVVLLHGLSVQHIQQLENSIDELGRLQTQLEQLALLAAGSAPQSARPAALELDELTLLSLVAEKLDTEIEARSVFGRFIDLIQPVIPLDMLSVIYSREDSIPRGVICLQRAAHRRELESAFTDLAQQWQRRKRHATALSLHDAKVYGEELIRQNEARGEERELGRCEVFPLFIDNDLFAVVSVAALASIMADRRRMRLLAFLLHQLMLHVKKNELLEQNSSLQTIDALTGLYNERHFYQQLEREFDRAKRYNVPLCLQIFDVDHFKDVNEAYGFETGDQLLREVSRILMENVRTTDFVCRYGGERFLLLLPETHTKNAEILANRLRRYIENFSFFIQNTNVFIKVTVSAGVTSFLEHNPASVAQFIEFADTALYFAKRNGRNQVVGYGYVMSLMAGESGHHG